jgi:hypothetical protein
LSYKEEIAALDLAIEALEWKSRKLLTFDANVVKKLKVQGYISGDEKLEQYEKYVKAMSVLEHLKQRIKAQKGLF